MFLTFVSLICAVSVGGSGKQREFFYESYFFESVNAFLLSEEKQSKL